MARRYDSATFLRRLERFADFNLTTDVIVGFPGEDERAFERTLRVVDRAGITKVHVPVLAAARHGDRRQRHGAAAGEKDRSARLRAASREACERRWRSKLGRRDVLVDREGRGYGDDYSPWLLDGTVGDLVAVRAADVCEEGIIAA